MTMRHRIRLSVAIALVATALPFSTAAPACAGEGDRAALVVDTGASVHRFCVALPEGDVSGLDLIVLANEQHGLDYRFGFGGEAVCMLAGVGADGDDCFERYPDFWGYWRGDGSGEWQWSGSGAGSTRVEDGDVEGWAWGSGSDGSTHPSPPATTFGSVCATAAPPADEEEPDGRPQSPPRAEGGKGDGGGSSAAPGPTAPAASAAAPPAAGDRPGGRPKGHRTQRPQTAARKHRPAPRSTAAPEPGLPASAQGEGSGETDAPPPTGVAALAAAGLVGAAAWVLARRRRSGS